VLRDNGEGARISESNLYLKNSEVSGNEVLGVFAEESSMLRAQGTTFFENGQGHIGAIRRSDVELADCEVGSPGDATGLALFAQYGSRVGAYSSSASSIVGGAYALFDSQLELNGVSLSDEVTVQDFSWIRLENAVVHAVTCQTGSDVICGPSSTATVSGCGPVSGTCNGKAAAAPAAPRIPSTDPKTWTIFQPRGQPDKPRE
jgi:hypothetical protein